MQDKYGREVSPEHGEHTEVLYDKAQLLARSVRTEEIKPAKYRIVEALYEYELTVSEAKMIFESILKDVEWKQEQQRVKDLFLRPADARERAGQHSFPDSRD